METSQARAQRIIQSDKDKLILDEACCRLSVSALRLSSESCSVLDVFICFNCAQQLVGIFDKQNNHHEKLQMLIWLFNILNREIAKSNKSDLYRKCCQRKMMMTYQLLHSTSKIMGNVVPFVKPQVDDSINKA